MSEPVLIEIGKRYKLHSKSGTIGRASLNDRTVCVRICGIGTINFEEFDNIYLFCTIEEIELFGNIVLVFVKHVNYRECY